MESLLSIMAARTAATALELGGKAVAAAARPFDLALEAASKAAEPSDPASAALVDQSASLHHRVAAQLQELLESCGLERGDRIELAIDPAAGEITVSKLHPAAADVEQALEQRPELLDDLVRLAELNATFDEGFAAAEAEAAIELGESGEPAQLEWRTFG
jgi:hypothetical protein